MKVRELIEILQKHDPEMDTLSTDFDGWCYAITCVETDHCDSDGRLCDDDNPKSTGVSVMLKS